MNRYDIALDLDKSLRHKRYMPVVLRQGDRNGCQIAVTITDHGGDVDQSLVPYLVAQLPSGSYYRQSGTWEDGVAVVDVDEPHFASETGKAVTAYFELRDGADVIATTQDFPLRTIPNATGDGSVAEPYDSAIEDAIASVNDATERAESGIEEMDKAMRGLYDAISVIPTGQIGDMF